MAREKHELTDAQQQAVDLYLEHKSLRDVARKLGISYTAARERIHSAMKWSGLDPFIQKELVKLGMTPADGARGISHGWIPHKDENGVGPNLFFKSPEPEIDVDDFIAILEERLEQIQPVEPRPVEFPVETKLDLHLPRADVHLGAKVDEAKTGIPYDRKIAKERMLHGFADLMASAPPVKVITMCDNGDTSHQSDDTDQTPKNRHKLKCDGTWGDAAADIVAANIACIDAGLDHAERVRYAILKGNHDPSTPVPVSMALRAWYRNEPRVTIEDLGESVFYTPVFGQVFTCYTHGHTNTPEEIAKNLPYREKKKFSQTSHHYLFTAHKHNYKVVSHGGMRLTQLMPVCPLDDHSHDGGYTDRSGVGAFLMHRSRGMIKSWETHFHV